MADTLRRHPAFSAAVLYAMKCAAATTRSQAQWAAQAVHGDAAPGVSAARATPAAPKGGRAVYAHVPGPSVSDGTQGPSTSPADLADSSDATIGKLLVPR